MRNKLVLVSLGLLIALGLVVGLFGCAGPTTTPTLSPASSPTMTPALSPTQTATSTPSSSPSQAAKIKLKGQNQYFIGPPVAHWPYSGSGYFAIIWSKFMNDISDGQIETEILTPGAIVPATETLQAVSKGVLDCAVLHYPGFYTSKYPELNVEIGMPFAWTRMEEHYDAMFYWGLYKEYQEFYENELNVHVLPFGCNDIYHFGTTFPVDSPDAIKGKKIRATGIYGEYVKALGGAPTVVAAGEIYQALKLGTIDGTIYGISGLSEIKLKEVWKYYVVQPNPSIIGANAIINLDKWKTLPERVRRLYDAWGYSVIFAGLSEYQQFEQYLIKDAEETTPFKTVRWSEADTARVYQISIGLWDGVAQANPRAARWVGIVKDQARFLGKIK